MLVLGIDPGTRNLGYGLVRREGTRLSHLGHGVIELSADLPLAARLVCLEVELSEVLGRFRPDLAVVESLFFHKDAQAAAKLGHARGVVLLVLARATIPILELAPARVKRLVSGHGRADKRQVALMMKSLFGLTSLPRHDATDALALAVAQLRLGPLAELAGAKGRTTLPARRAVSASQARAALAKLARERGKR